MEFTQIPRRDGWLEVRDEQLEQPFRIRLGVKRGRFVVLGIEVDNNAEITTKTLRGIRLGATVDEWTAWMQHDEQNARTWDRRLADHLVKRRQQGIELTADELASLEAYGSEVSAELAKWRDLLERLPKVAELTPARGRGAAPPTQDELQQFARAYIEQFMERPRGAVTRVAARLGMHRVTAHRWITLCRDAGYLPAEEDA